MNISRFIEDTKSFGLKVAIYNVKFSFCYWLLGAKIMRVTPKK